MKPSELAKELGVTPQKIGLVRRSLGLPKGELTEAEAGMIREELGVDECEPDSFGPKFCMGVVTFAQKGSRQIEVTLDNEKHQRVRAFVPLDFNAENLWLQRIKLEYIDYEDERYYRHAALSNKTWAAMSPVLRNVQAD